MSEQPPSEHSLETLLASIWSRREAGIKLPADSELFRPITAKDIEYLCNYNYPYLQIMNSTAKFDEEVFPTFIMLPNKWVLMDYQDAMCSSYSTKHCFKNKMNTNVEVIVLAEDNEFEDEEDEDEDYSESDVVEKARESTEGVGGDGDGNEGDGGKKGDDGTIIKQQFDTVFAMINEAKSKGWAAIEIVAGTTLMQFYAWAIAKELGIELYGYTPTEEQERHYKAMEREKVVEIVRKKRRMEFSARFSPE